MKNRTTKARALKWSPIIPIWVIFIAFLGVWAVMSEEDHIKVAVFNFNIQNIEASGYGSNITNQLINALQAYPSLAIMDRKELEQFLSLNEFQQNDDPKNIFSVGNRLGLEFIIVGKVDKQNANLFIDCRVFKIDQQMEVLSRNLKLLGDAKLSMELKKLAEQISLAIIKAKSETPALPQLMDMQMKAGCQLTAKPGRSKILLYWQAPDKFPAVDYKIYRATSLAGPFIKIGQTHESQYQDMEVDAKTQYFYKIKAYDSKGAESAFSAPAQASTVPTPEPPIILKAESHVKGIAVFWTPNPMERPDAGKTVVFNIYRCQNDEGPVQKIGQVEVKPADQGFWGKSVLPAFSFLDKSLEDGAEYYYSITASNQENHESDFSKRIGQKSVGKAEQLEAEGELIRKIRLKWQGAEDAFAKGYVIYRSHTKNEGFREIHRTGEIATHHFEDTAGLEDGNLYYYYVTVYEDPDRETAPSAIVSAQTKGPPPGPDHIEAQSGLVKKVKLQWSPILQEEIAGYKIYRALNEAGPYALIATLNDRTADGYTDSGAFLQSLEDNMVYFYRVATFNPVNIESRTYAEATAKTKARPQKPQGLWAGGLRLQKIPLDWHANQEEDIVYYHIYRKESGSDFFTAIGKTGIEIHYVDTGLKNGTEYTYQIKAEDKDGLISDASDSVSIRTKPKPRAPQGLKVRYENHDAVLSWQANPEMDIASYVIYERFLILVNKVASAPGTEYRFSALNPGSNKTVFITAVDQDGLESEYSAPITLTQP